MERIREFDEAIEAWKRGCGTETGEAEYAVIAAYWDSIEAGNETVNFDGVLWERLVGEMVAILRKSGIAHITITNGYSGLLEIIAEFERHGCRLVGMTTASTPRTDWETGEREVKPAAKILL